MKNNLFKKILSRTNIIFLLVLVILFSNRVSAKEQIVKTRFPERSLNDMLNNSDKYIIVGDKGTILYSGDRLEFINIDIHIGNNINAINWWQNCFIAVGEGIILTSMDGKKWNKYYLDKEEPDTTLNLRGVSSNQDMIVSVGEGLIMTSNNGENWKKNRIDTTIVLNDILYEDNQFIAVGSKVIKESRKPLIMISTDAKQWTEVILEDECTINEIVYKDGKYSALGENGQLFISNNGQDWDIHDEKFIGDRSHIYDFRSMVIGYDKMLMGGKMSHWMYTHDVYGIIVDLNKNIMEIDSMINTLQINKIYWDGNTFFAIGKSFIGKDIFISSDGKQWKSIEKDCNFNDVYPSDWFYDAIIYLKEKELIMGYADQSFRPDDNISIEEFIVLVLRATGEHLEISNESNWADDYIEKAISLGFINRDEFAHMYTQPIKREEMVKILTNLYKKETTDASSYASLIKDYDDIHTKYQPFVLKAYATGIIKGYEDGFFKPHKNVKRSEAADVLYRLLNNR